MLDPRWSLLGSKLGVRGGSWGQVRLQNRPKIDQKSDHILDTFSDRFLIAFWRLLGRILVDFWSQVEGQVDQKIDHIASSWQVRRRSKKAKKQLVFQGFLAPRPSNFDPKLTKKRPQTDQKSSKNLVSILIQFLMHLGGQLGPQDPPKTLPKSIKNHTLPGRVVCNLRVGPDSGCMDDDWPAAHLRG